MVEKQREGEEIDSSLVRKVVDSLGAFSFSFLLCSLFWVSGWQKGVGSEGGGGARLERAQCCTEKGLEETSR